VLASAEYFELAASGQRVIRRGSGFGFELASAWFRILSSPPQRDNGQPAEYESEVGTFSLIGPASMRLSFTLSSPPATITLNLLAVLLVVVAGKIALLMKAQDKRVS
jgi:hypothetical protein